jgi:putative membrane protein
MLRIIAYLLALSVSVYLTAKVVPGIRLRGFKAAIAVAAVYSLLNFLLFKVFIFITFPLVILKWLTLGIVGLLLNAILLMITDKLLDDFELSGFGSALLGALGISLMNTLLSWIFHLPAFH